MPSVEELLVNSLEELGKDLKCFKWYLKNQKHISKSEMEDADIFDTVDKMVASLRPEGAVKITVNFLRKMNQNNLSEQLESKYKTVSGFGVYSNSSVSPRDIKQRPERNNSDTHTTGLSEKHLEKDEPCLNTDADKARYFNSHWSDLIQGVTNGQIIADKLCQQELLHDEQYSEITQSLTSQESMRKICNIIRKHRDPVKAKFISILQKEKLYPF